MGLDLVELFMRFEEEFGVEIPDEVASTLFTPRNVIDYLMTKPQIYNQWSRDFVAQKVWLIMKDEVNIDQEKFTEDSRFIDDLNID